MSDFFKGWRAGVGAVLVMVRLLVPDTLYKTIKVYRYEATDSFVMVCVCNVGVASE